MVDKEFVSLASTKVMQRNFIHVWLSMGITRLRMIIVSLLRNF